MRRARLISFYVLAFAISWACWLPLVASGQIIHPGLWPSHAPGLLGPALAAIIMTAFRDGRPGLADLGRRAIRWRIGLVPTAVVLAPAVLYLAAIVVKWRIDGSWPQVDDLGRMNGFPTGSPLLLWLLLVMLSGFGEETGWRGYALGCLRERHGLLASALLFAPVWAAWHLPTFALLEGYRGFSSVDLVGFLIGLACGALVLAWLYERSGKSLLAVALWHGTFNVFSGTVAARGLPAAVVTTGVIVFAVVLAVREIRQRRVPLPNSDARVI